MDILTKLDKYLTEEKKSKKSFSLDEAKEIGKKLGLDWKDFSPEEFRIGLDIELEHGTINPKTNLTNDDPIMTGKITLAHLNEIKDYNTRLKKMEKDAKS